MRYVPQTSCPLLSADHREQMWRPSGHPKLWFLGGALALCRVYSRFLALQIMASEKSL